MPGTELSLAIPIRAGNRTLRSWRRPRLQNLLVLGFLVMPILAPGCSGGKKQKQLPSSEILFQEAQGKFAKKKYYKAQELLNSVINHPSTDPAILADAQLLLADAYFFQKGFLNLTEAQSRYQTFLTFHPRHPRADYAQFQLAMCYFLQVLEPDRDQNLTRRAIEEYQKVEDLYPGSAYVEPSREKIIDCWDRVAEHIFLVGQFYLKRKAPRAAIERFLEVLEQYPEYRGKEELYYYLSRAYDRDGQPEKAREFLSLLLLDFPRGKYAGKARKSLLRIAPAIDSRAIDPGPPFQWMSDTGTAGRSGPPLPELFSGVPA